MDTDSPKRQGERLPSGTCMPDPNPHAVSRLTSERARDPNLEATGEAWCLMQATLLPLFMPGVSP